MRITKRQLKRIIREEYSRLKRRGLIREMHDDFEQPDDYGLDDPAYCAEKDFMGGEFGDSIPPGASEEFKAAYEAAWQQTEEDYEDYLEDSADPTRYTPSYSRSSYSSLSYPGEYYDPEWGDSPKDREH